MNQSSLNSEENKIVCPYCGSTNVEKLTRYGCFAWIADVIGFLIICIVLVK